MNVFDDPRMRDLRILDKLVDDLAKGKPMEKILPRLPQQDDTFNKIDNRIWF